MKPENLDLAIIKLENALTVYSLDYKIDDDIEIVFLGSQSILFHHRNINHNAILNSYEIDVIVLLGEKNKSNLQKISNHLDFVYGYGSSLHDEEFFYIDNMSTPEDEELMIRRFPKNWRDRAKVQLGVNNSKIKFIALDIHDVCALKLVANRDKDLSYVKSLIQGSVLDKRILKRSLTEMNHVLDGKQMMDIKNKVNYFYTLPQLNIFNKSQQLKK